MSEGQAAKRPGAGVIIDADQLIRLRQERLLSRAELAALMSEDGEFSYTPDAVAKIENRKRRPKVATLRRLCAVLGCAPEDLLPPREDTAPVECPECSALFGHEPGCQYAT